MSFHATRVLNGRPHELRGWAATLATNDPAGRRIAVRLAPDAEGVISLRAVVTGGARWRPPSIGFGARRGERYLGFGERSNRVDQRGGEVESYVAEGPYEEDERAVIPAFVPAWGFHPREDATYFPMPWLLSTAGYGVLVDDSDTSYFHLDQGGSGVWSVEVRAPRLDLRVFAGPRPADVLRRLTGRIGLQPPVPAPFVFGPWYQPTRRGRGGGCSRSCATATCPSRWPRPTPTTCPAPRRRGASDAERDAGGPLPRRRPGRHHLLQPDDLHRASLVRGRRGRRSAGEEPRGRPYEYSYSTLESFRVAQFDFTAAAGRDLYGRLLREAVADGHDGWMEDFGEYTPLDAVAVRRVERRGPAQRLPPPVPLRRGRRGGGREPAARPLRALRAGRAAPAARRWSGAATLAWTGASTACARWSPTG